MADHLHRFPEFAEQVRAKLARGQVIFEDRNFSKNPVDLMHEVQEELVDVMGWSFLVWSRLQAMREALELLGFEPQEGLPKASGKPSEDSPLPQARQRDRRLGGLLGALREAHAIEGDLLGQLIAAMTTRAEVVSSAPRVDAKDEALRMTGADRGKLLPDPKDGLCL